MTPHELDSAGFRRQSLLALNAREILIGGLFCLPAALSLLGLVATIAVFGYQSWLFFHQVPGWTLLTDNEWTPLFASQKYGIRVLAGATLMVSAIAMGVAMPLGLMGAIYLSYYAPSSLRRILKPTLESLAGVPTIVYGYFALQFVTPNLRTFIPNIATFNSLSAGIVTGILIIPIISSMSEDALRSIPKELHQGGYAAGFTKLEVMLDIVLPAAIPGVLASFLLAASRALSETMIAYIAAGQNPQATLNPLVPAETITAFIIQVSLGDVPSDSLLFHTIFAVGAILFGLTLLLNLFGQWLIHRYSRTISGLYISTASPITAGRGIAPRLQGYVRDLIQRVQPASPGLFRYQLPSRMAYESLVVTLGFLASLTGVVILSALLLGTFRQGFTMLDVSFLTRYPSRDPTDAGIRAALMGTLWLLVIVAVLSFAIGIGTAIFLEEYLPQNRWSRWIEVSLNNAAAIPSIIYGLLGLALFMRWLSPVTGGRTVLAGGLILTTIALPTVIINARSALRRIPDTLRHGAYGLGMTRAQAIYHVLLPEALPGIMTGMLLALSRTVGETSPLVAGAFAFIQLTPPLSLAGLTSPLATLPTQIFFWASRPQADFRALTAAAIIVLGAIVLLINISAVLLRDAYRRHV
ncbi:MAG: phosphate ABC transporter permease PstA [Elainellaceae cyanobacterium]